MPTPSRDRRPASRPVSGLLGLLGLLALGVVPGGSGTVFGAAPSPAPAASPVVTPVETPAATPAASATPGPSPTAPPVGVPDGYLPGTINGALVREREAGRATRHPIAAMVDDQVAARPQSGLITADLVIQAPAEGGIPRYLAFWQNGDADAIGPIRSSRLYYVAWAAEWRAVYAHVGGAPNALHYLSQVNGKLVWNAEELRWGPTTGCMVRIRDRDAPHNVYTSSRQLFKLADRLGADAPVDTAAWTFIDDAPLDARPDGGTIVVPYLYNRVSMRYDRSTNRYLRSVTGEEIQTDVANGQPVAPRNVIVQFVKVGRLPNRVGEGTNAAKGRLELGFLGSGRAIVMRNGEVIEATWSKASDGAPTLFRYASGPRTGEPVELVRGQIMIQVVPRGLGIVVKAGTPAAVAAPAGGARAAVAAPAGVAPAGVAPAGAPARVPAP